MKTMAIVAVVLLAACSKTPAERAAYYCGGDGMSLAGVMVRDAVKTRLKSPSTASFDVARLRHLGDCKIIVIGKVDAQNSFGATLRRSYFATIRYDPSDDSWQTLTAEIVE